MAECPTDLLSKASVPLPFDLLPCTDYLVVPISWLIQTAKSPKYISFLQLQYLASANAGFLRTVDIRRICDSLGWSQREVFNRMNELRKIGLIKKVSISGHGVTRETRWHLKGTYRVFQESKLGLEFDDKKKAYDGMRTIRIHRDTLLGADVRKWKGMILGAILKTKQETRGRIERMFVRWEHQCKLHGSFQMRQVDMETAELTNPRGTIEDVERMRKLYANKLDIDWQDITSSLQDKSSKSNRPRFLLQSDEYMGETDEDNIIKAKKGNIYTCVWSHRPLQPGKSTFTPLKAKVEAKPSSITQVVGVPRSFFDKEHKRRNAAKKAIDKAPPVIEEMSTDVADTLASVMTHVYSGAMSLREAAKVLGVGHVTVWRWLKNSDDSFASRKRYLVLSGGQDFALAKQWNDMHSSTTVPLDLQGMAVVIRTASLRKAIKNGADVDFRNLGEKWGLINLKENEFVTVVQFKSSLTYKHKVA